MISGVDIFKTIALAKSVIPFFKYIIETPKPLLEDDPKEFELDVKGKKIYTLQYTFAFDTKEQREEYLTRDEDFQDLMNSFGKFAEKQKKNKKE